MLTENPNMTVSVDKQICVDDVGGGVTYYGYADPGVPTTEARWAIKRVTVSGSDSVTDFPAFDASGPTPDNKFIWDDRLTYAYGLTRETTAPTLSTVTISSNNNDTTKAKVGDIITLTLIASEAISKPTITIAGHAIAAANVIKGNDAAHWTATYTMATGDTAGTVVFSIAFADLSNNSGVTVSAITGGSEVTFDKTVPTLTTVSIASNNTNTALAKVGDTVTVTIVASELLTSKPTFTIRGSAIAAGNVTQGGDATQWTATYVMAGGDTEGVVPFTVNGTDIAGNAMVQVTAVTDASSVTFDKTAPTATLTYSKDAGGTYATTIRVRDADTLRVKAVFSEPLLDSPVVKLAIDNAILAATNMTKVSTTEYYYDLNVPVGDVATATCSMSVGTDTAGNVVTAAPTNATFAVDNTVPTLSSATRTNNTTLDVVLSELGLTASITKANDGGFTVEETGSPGTTYTVSAIAPGADNTHVVLTVASVAASAAAGLTVKYATGGNGTVSDGAGNPLATNATGLVIAPW